MGNFKTSLIIFVIPLLFLGCGEENDSQKVDLNIIPEKPVVINSDFTIDPTPSDSNSGDETIVTGPWFSVRFSGSNPTDRTLIIAGASFEVKGRDANGAETTTTSKVELINQTILISVAANEDFVFPGLIYVDGLNESISSYRAEMILEGWFNGTEDDPETPEDETQQPAEAFRRTVVFTTQ